ncbi:MAG: regulatory iron-sulfur-containing complex subunit RicT [Bacilli bacterium]|nr:regulatory iron-sulfur-containing complex subunit RicT [Bacilli bacterium]
MNICGVKFKENGKTYNFFYENMEIDINDYVVVETEKGKQYGKVVFLDKNRSFKQLKYVIRKSTESDYNQYLKNLADGKKALLDAKVTSKELGLEMQFIDCNYTFDRKQLLFNFVADERVDFRELVKRLAGKFRTRIELHQIGVRDKAREVSGIGQCGRELCCAKFLNSIDTISINMAKNQNIALNPSKINGTCGRLLCCLSYEDSQYTDCRKSLPHLGEKIKYENKMLKVISIDILNQSYKLDNDGEKIEIKLKNCGGCN